MAWGPHAGRAQHRDKPEDCLFYFIFPNDIGPNIIGHNAPSPKPSAAESAEGHLGKEKRKNLVPRVDLGLQGKTLTLRGHPG